MHHPLNSLVKGISKESPVELCQEHVNASRNVLHPIKVEVMAATARHRCGTPGYESHFAKGQNPVGFVLEIWLFWEFVVSGFALSFATVVDVVFGTILSTVKIQKIGGQRSEEFKKNV